MIDDFIGLNVFWSFLYASLSVFFIVTAIYFDRRTFIKLAGLLGLVALVTLTETIANHFGANRIGFAFAQVPLLVFAWSPALHSDFVITHYAGGWGNGGFQLVTFAPCPPPPLIWF